MLIFLMCKSNERHLPHYPFKTIIFANMFGETVDFLHELALTERNNSLSTLLLLATLLGISLLGLSLLTTPNLLGRVTGDFFKMAWKDNEFSENLRMRATTSFALLGNFILSLGLCVFLLVSKNTTPFYALVFTILSVGSLLLIQQMGFRIIVFTAGEKSFSPIISLMTRHIWKFSGLVFLFLSLAWILNQQGHAYFRLIFLSIFGITLIIRWLKGLIFALRRRVSWYYFILYLCTLEILPVVLVIHWLILKFRVI
jgi:hypothetical protein